MIHLRALAVSVAKTGLSSMPLLLAPLLLGPTQELLDFFQLQLVQSILMVLGSLGMGSYLFSIAERSNSLRADAIQLLKIRSLFGVTGVVIFNITGWFIFFSSDQSSWLEKSLYLLLVPFSYFYVLQQIELGRGRFRLALINFAIPPAIFSILLVAVWIVGVNHFNVVSAIVLLITNLIFIGQYDILKSLKRLCSRPRRLAIQKTVLDLKYQISAGVLLASCSPLIALILINWLSSLNYLPQLIGTYYLYVRGIEALIGLATTYFVAGHFHKNISGSFLAPGFRGFSLALLALGMVYLALNLATFLLIGYFDYWMSGIELATGLIKFLLAILSVSYIVNHPVITGIKEGVVLALILVIKEFHTPSSIYDFQILVMMSYFVALILMATKIYFSNSRKIS